MKDSQEKIKDIRVEGYLGNSVKSYLMEKVK